MYINPFHEKIGNKLPNINEKNNNDNNTMYFHSFLFTNNTYIASNTANCVDL